MALVEGAVLLSWPWAELELTAGAARLDTASVSRGTWEGKHTPGCRSWSSGIGFHANRFWRRSSPRWRAGVASRLLCGCGGWACEVTFAASFQMMACIRVEKPHLSCLSTSSPSAASISPCGGARKEKEKYAGVQKKECVGRRGVTPTRGSLHTPEASVRASAGKLQSNREVAKKEVVPAAGTGAGAGGPPA